MVVFLVTAFLLSTAMMESIRFSVLFSFSEVTRTLALTQANIAWRRLIETRRFSSTGIMLDSVKEVQVQDIITWIPTSSRPLGSVPKM